MRIPKEVGRKYVHFLKNLHVTAHFWDPRAKSAFEIFRQLNSPVLKKINAKFECSFDMPDEMVEPILKVEYVDGSKLDTSTVGFTAMDLRGMIFSHAIDLEDVVEMDIPGDEDDDDEDGAGKKGGGDKGGAKGGKK